MKSTRARKPRAIWALVWEQDHKPVRTGDHCIAFLTRRNAVTYLKAAGYFGATLAEYVPAPKRARKGKKP